MDVIYISIANFIFKIILHPSEIKFLKDKLEKDILEYYKYFILPEINAPPDTEIHVYPHQHQFFLRKKSNRVFYDALFEIKNNGLIVTTYDIGIIQFSHVIRYLLLQKLISKKGFALHASAVRHENSALIFLGPSGAGKSTISGNLQDKFPILGDDCVFIRKERSDFYLYQSPFVEKEKSIHGDRKKYKIIKVFFLKKSSYFKTVKITDKNQIISLLAPQLLSDKEKISKQLVYLYEFADRFSKFYDFYFAKDKRGALNFRFFKEKYTTSKNCTELDKLYNNLRAKHNM